MKTLPLTLTLTLTLCLLMSSIVHATTSSKHSPRSSPGPTTTSVPDVNVNIDVASQAPDVDVVNDVTVPVTVGGPIVEGTSVNNNVEFQDRKQAPSQGLSTPPGSTGIGLQGLGWGVMLNLPWTFGDKKILPICDRLLGTPDWGPCMCKTSVLKTLHATPELCATSLGGGSVDLGK